jgi:excisionase family DNA binding protein
MAVQRSKLTLPDLAGRRESANALGVSVRLLDYLIERRELCVVRIGKRVLIPVADLKRFVEERTVQPAT